MLRGIAAYVRRHHIALLALFFALGGTAVAASNVLPRNSVGSRQVINGSLQKGDLSVKAVRALKGNRGAQGAPGAAGPQGPAGSQGAKGDQGIQGLRGPSFGDAKYLGSVPVASCGTDASTMTLPVNLTAPSRIYAVAGADYTRTDPGAEQPSIRIQLVSGATLVASTRRNLATSAASSRVTLSVAGVLRQSTSGGSGFDVPAGAYTLRVVYDNFGSCQGTGTYQDTSLNYVLLGTA
jgi:hypothetical protein